MADDLRYAVDKLTAPELRAWLIRTTNNAELPGFFRAGYGTHYCDDATGLMLDPGKDGQKWTASFGGGRGYALPTGSGATPVEAVAALIEDLQTYQSDAKTVMERLKGVNQ